MACGVMTHSIAPLVAPAATSDRTTNQPLLRLERASSSSRSPVFDSISMRWPSVSGAMEIRGPVASGSGCTSLELSRVSGPFACRGKMPDVLPRYQLLPKRSLGKSSKGRDGHVESRYVGLRTRVAHLEHQLSLGYHFDRSAADRP